MYNLKISIRAVVFVVSLLTVSCADASSESEAGSPAAKSPNSIPKVTKGQIRIDGLDKDWSGIDALIDEVGLPSEGGSGGFDVKKLYLAYDEQNLYFLITMDKGVDEYLAQKQSSGCIGDIYLDTDNKSDTGCINKMMFAYGNITGYDYKIWIPTSSGIMRAGKKYPSVTCEVYRPNKQRNSFFGFAIYEHRSSEDNSKIQFSGKNVEFLIPLETLNVKKGITVKAVFAESANQFNKNGNTPFSFVLKEDGSTEGQD